MKTLLLTALIIVSTAQAKVLFILTNHSQMGDTGKRTGFYLSELTHPYYILNDKGIEIEIASPLGGPSPIDPTSLDMKDKDNKRFFEDAKLMKSVLTTKKLSDLNPKDYKAVVFSGGHGTVWDFTEDDTIKKFIRDVYENNAVVSAICHGPAALVDVKLSNGKYLVEGKKVAVFSDEEERIVKLEKVVPYLLETKLKKQGAISVAGKPWSSSAVADGRLITGQNPQSAHEVGKLILKQIK